MPVTSRGRRRRSARVPGSGQGLFQQWEAERGCSQLRICAGSRVPFLCPRRHELAPARARHSCVRGLCSEREPSTFTRRYVPTAIINKRGGKFWHGYGRKPTDFSRFSNFPTKIVFPVGANIPVKEERVRVRP